MVRMKNKVKEQPRRIFCGHAKRVIRMDHVERHGCIEYDPSMNMRPKSCHVCKKSSNLMLDGSLTEVQKRIVAEVKGEEPGFVGGL